MLFLCIPVATQLTVVLLAILGYQKQHLIPKIQCIALSHLPIIQHGKQLKQAYNPQTFYTIELHYIHVKQQVVL